MGVPFTFVLVRNWFLSLDVLMPGLCFFVPLTWLFSLLTTLYFWRFIEIIFFPKRTGGGGRGAGVRTQNSDTGGEAPLGMLIPTLILAGLCIFFGIAAFIPVSVAEKTAAMLLGGV